MKIGANYKADGKCEFAVWSPIAKKISLRIVVRGMRSVKKYIQD